MKKQSWRPDWQQEDQYPQPENTSPEQWGWEFLRRNPEYQRLWPTIFQKGHPRNEPRTARRHPGRRTRFRLNSEPSTAFLQQFRVSYPPPEPSQAMADPGFQTEFVQYEASSDRAKNIMGRLEPYQMVPWLNLEWPIEAQLLKVKGIFKALREEWNLRTKDWRNRFGNYKSYLRILDALDAKATTDQIRRTLYPKLPPESQVQRLRDSITAAKRLRDHDYWRIPLTRAKK
jgi:hypothetical protein